MDPKKKLLVLIILLIMESEEVFSQRKGFFPYRPSSPLTASRTTTITTTEDTPIQIVGRGGRLGFNDADEVDKKERENTRNVVRLAATDQLNSEIITNRTRAYLSCESGEMIVKINFSAPFRGVAYANYDRSSHCKFYGDGSRYYEMIIPLKGCGTKQEAPRLFINNIIFRFHRSLELEEDEIKTIICRYPPPLAPPPLDPVPPVLEPTAPVPIIVPTKLSEIELLLIICGLLFLTLLLLGIGIAYYCLKRRNIKIVRKKKGLSTGAPSEITKLSQSTVFDQIRIPRATAFSATESSGTIPSDYPSESLSDDDGRRTIVSETSTMRHDHFKYENSAFVAESYPMDVEKADSVSSFPPPALLKPNITTQSYCTTMLNTENITEEDVLDTVHRRTTSQLYKKLPSSRVRAPSIPDNDDRSETEIMESISRREMMSIERNGDWSERWSSMRDDHLLETEEFMMENETRTKMVAVPPRITVKKIDDLYVTNISEIRTEEHIRRIKELHGDKQRSTQLETHHHHQNHSTTQIDNCDNYGRSISVVPYSAQPTREISETFREDTETIRRDTSIPNSSRYFTASTTSTVDRQKPPRNFSTLSTPRFKSEIIIDILDNPPSIRGVEELSSTVKNKWRTVVTTDEIFRSLILESTTTEEYIRISRDVRYEKMFDPRTWEIIINILTHPDVVNATTQTEYSVVTKSSTGCRKKQGSYSSGAMLSRLHSMAESSYSRASSKLGSVMDYDLRSITEEDVNFTRPESIWSTSRRGSHEELTKVL